MESNHLKINFFNPLRNRKNRVLKNTRNSLRVRLVHWTGWNRTEQVCPMFGMTMWDTLEPSGTHMGHACPSSTPWNKREQPLLFPTHPLKKTKNTTHRRLHA